MSKAETIPNTSRRNFLAGAAGAAGSALVSTTGEAASGPDARLIELGRQLVENDRQERLACARVKPLENQHDMLLKEWMDKNPEASDKEYADEYGRLYDHLGMSKPGVHPDHWSGLIQPIADEIMAIPAVTLAGLAAKAQLAKTQAGHFWDASNDDSDWDILCVRQLVDAVLDMASRHPAPISI
jgi:hypothetical protein